MWGNVRVVFMIWGIWRFRGVVRGCDLWLMAFIVGLVCLCVLI